MARDAAGEKPPNVSQESFQAYSRARDSVAAFAASLQPGEDLLILCGYIDPKERGLKVDCFGLFTQDFLRNPVDVLHRGGDGAITILAISRRAYLDALNKKLVADALSSEVAEGMTKIKKSADRATVLIVSMGAFRGFLSVTLGVLGEIE